MKTDDIKYLMVAQLLFWLGLVVFTRWSWIAEVAPSWSSLLLYSAFGLVFSSALAVAIVQLERRNQLAMLVGTAILTVIAALCARAAANALEYHVLFSSSNSYEFWGYFHYGRQSVYQMLLWSSGFLVWRYLRHNPPSSEDIKPSSSTAYSPLPHDVRIVVKDGQKTQFISPASIESIVSGKDYLCITVEGKVLIHRATMKHFLSQLPEYFLRCHRSHCVNLNYVSALTSENGELSITLTSGATHPTSRRLRADVKSVISQRLS